MARVGVGDAINRFMDQLEPAEDYYTRQMDNRGGCSKIRSKLRKYARMEGNEANLAVAHWLETSTWQPPNHKTLSALVSLLRSMIR